MSIEAMKLALEALEMEAKGYADKHKRLYPAAHALRQAISEAEGRSIEQAEQAQPVAWMFQHEETGRIMCVDAQQVEWGFENGNPRLKKIAPLYTVPPQRQWVGLTDAEIEACNRTTTNEGTPCVLVWGDDFQESGIPFAKAIEAKLKENNT